MNAGWYDDPVDASQHRYWNGEAWTEHVSPKVARPASPAAQPPAPLAPVVSAASSRPPRTPALDPARTVTWPYGAAQWCRACGADQVEQGQTCDRCQWPLGDRGSAASRVGLVYEFGKLGGLMKRLGVCVAETATEATIHLDDKPDRVIPIAELSAPTAHTSQDALPTVRLHLFDELGRTKAIKTKTDSTKVMQLAAELARVDVVSMRALYDTALAREWPGVIAQSALSPTEQAWRSAHHFAATDDCRRLIENLALLPAEGYIGRTGLLMPHLNECLVEHRDALQSLLQSWSSSLPGVQPLATLADGDGAAANEWRDAAKFYCGLLPAPAQQQWSEALTRLADGEVGEPVRSNCKLWAAHSAFASQAGGEPLDAHHVPLLPLAFLEQAMSNEALGAATIDSTLDGPKRAYLLARLEPERLTLEELRSIDHWSELARRSFVDHNETLLQSLPSDDLMVRHYRALFRFRDGQPHEADWLQPDAKQTLQAFATARAAIVSGETKTLPDHLLLDPTLWPALQQQALSGKLTVALDQRAVFPKFAEWVDLHAVVAMLWNRQFSEAEALSQQLATVLTVEELRDEALNLQAFALYQMGRPGEALTVLEDAMEGEYTEALLINTSLVAASAEPSVAAGYLGRLVDEAPTDELRVAAVRQALNVWGDEEELPEETIRSLRQVVVLPELSDDDYIDFVRLSSMVDRHGMAENPPDRPTTMTKAVAYDVYTAKARTLAGGGQLAETSKSLIASIRLLPEASWLQVEVDNWVQLHFDLMSSNDFGQALGSASEIDEFLENGEDLLSPAIYFAGAPMAGANFSAFRREDGDTLSAAAIEKFFYRPSDRFQSERAELPDGLAEVIDHNFHATLTAFIIGTFLTVSDLMSNAASSYNALVKRLNWDYEHRYQIKNQMKTILRQQSTWLEPVDRSFYYLDLYQPRPTTKPEVLKMLNDARRDLKRMRDENDELR